MDEIQVYGLNSCDTCRKARRALQAADKSFSFTDVRLNKLGEADLRLFYNVLGEDLINRRSTTWRNLGESERAKAPVSLLLEYPALMKRPVIEYRGKLYLGWNSDVQSVLLGNEPPAS